MTAEIATPVELRKLGSWRTLARSLRYLRPYSWLVFGSYLLTMISNGITLATPLIMRSIVDQGIQAGNLRLIGTGVMALMGVTLLRGVCIFLSGRWTEVASQSVAYDVRNIIHDKLQNFSFSYHDQARTGQLLTRAIGDVDRIRFLTGRAFLRLVEVITLVVGIAVVMIAMNPRLALLTLLTVPALAYTALDFGRKYRPLSKIIQQQTSVLTERLDQNLRGARVVKAFAQEPAEVHRFDDENTALFSLNVEAGRLRALVLPLLNLIASAGTIVILLYGGQLVIRGELTIGQLVAFTTYVSQLLMPVRRLGTITAGTAHAIASSERVFEILDAQSEVTDGPDAQPIGPIQGLVRFEDVSFAYFGRHRVLEDISFEVQPGQIVALLGVTGSGKSSIINLIPRFYDATSGRICIDGIDIRDVRIKSLREQIGIVFQDTTLFATTIRQNIAFGQPEATHDQIIAAAQAAAAHDFITQLPQQYDTPVGERGVTLSGGQKQRIAIARAILKNPRILMLDDATSSVDTETEALIQAALNRLMQGRTSFIIAQRLSTIREADQVLVLDRGCIVARGSRTAEHTAHDELLKTSGLYAEIYHRQLRPKESASGKDGAG